MEAVLLRCTVEPCCNEDIGTIKFTSLWQVSCYQGKKKKPKEIQRTVTSKFPCYKRVLLFSMCKTLTGCSI